MKLLFINHAYPQDVFNQLYEDAGGILQIPDNVLQWNIIDGLSRNRVDFTLASIPALPAWPRYKHIITPSGLMRFSSKACGHYLRYYDAPFIKQMSETKVLYRYLKRWCEENKGEKRLYVLVYTQWSHHLKAALDIKKEYPQLVVGCIITDLIESAMEYASNRSFLKRIQITLELKAGKKMFPQVDKFILLTKLMEEHVSEAKGRSIVMEGIATPKNTDNCKGENNCANRILLYTGVLEEYAGVDQMVKAFLLTRDEKFRLVICGSGASETFIKRSAEKDLRIDFKGRVSHSEVIELQQQATILINPRRPNGKITKYSFPSKTMEYMASGTPMIGYKLEGMPSEYYNHMYFPDDLSIEALAKCINIVLNKSGKELEDKGNEAMRFVLTHKSSQVQVKRIIDFLEKNTNDET